jgi:hypothetical protein
MPAITRLLLIGLVATTPRLAPAQVFVGSVPLSLGEARATVLAKLRADYAVLPLDSAKDQWFVRSKGGPPFEFAANLAFTDGRLSFLSRSWDRPAPLDKASLQTAVQALAQLAPMADNHCSVTTSRSTQPEEEQETVEVTCGLHAVTLIVGTYKGSPTADVSESWRLAPRR